MSLSPDPVSIALGAAAAGLLVLTVTGCAGIQQALQHPHHETSSVYASAQESSVGFDESQALRRMRWDPVPR